jgi:hypothetical protein
MNNINFDYIGTWKSYNLTHENLDNDNKNYRKYPKRREKDNFGEKIIKRKRKIERERE